jgi:hypothetical protein
MADTFKICLAGTNTQVAGTEEITFPNEIGVWLLANQIYYEEGNPEKPGTDGSKYVVLPTDM